MSSSFVVESHQSGSKKDDTLIIVVNDDGTISVDQETLQNLIMNQSDAKVSVVRVGQSEGDAENGDLTLTVDPPTFERPGTESAPVTAAGTTDVAGLVDPFMEMDPEQLEKLETALQSEQAKQILGENVTAMLDMLTVEEQQKSIKYCVELDHCYTTRTSPTDPEPSDPLPIANSPDIIDNLEPNKHSSVQLASAVQPITDPNVVDNLTPNARSKILPRNATTRSIVGRGRKIANPVIQQATLMKASPTQSPRNPSGLAQQSPIRGVSTTVRVEPERKENESSASSSESSESEPPSDDDSDFGPRGPRRGGLRARGGRKGLTTRGGSTSATRRRSANKQMDLDQVRRLDMEMAAAVVAMKSPEKPERPERFSPAARGKKQRTRSVSGRKKEDASPSRGVTTELMTTSSAASGMPETQPSIIEKPLQTTNQVKADLINANMIKGDMILTKPGQGRYNQKVVLVQKKLMIRPNELKAIAPKRQSLVLAKNNKTTPLQIQTKLISSDEGKLTSVGPTAATKTTVPTSLEIQQTKPCTMISDTSVPLLSPTSTCSSASILGLEQQQQPPRIDTPPLQLPQQLLQHEQQSSNDSPRENIPTPSPPLRHKSIEMKREKRKSESENKVEDNLKSAENKTPDASKKHVKKDARKAPAVLAGLGPALFSTPDIIRRVGSDAKSLDHPGTPTLMQESTNSNATIVENPAIVASPSGSMKNQEESSSNVEPRTSTAADTTLVSGATDEEEISSRRNEDDDKTHANKVPMAEELESSLDPATNISPTVDNPEPIRPTEAPVVSNAIIPEQTGIEGEEHLLATLEMEAGKHDEELLAEALLLQEELGDDLADHPVLAESSNSMAEPLLTRTSTFEEPMETNANPQVSDKVVETNKSDATITLMASASVQESVKTSVETPKRRDEKEPIQIIRGGRVITLPPIEAPATRSKRLQAKSESPQKAIIETPKKEEKIGKQALAVQHQRPKEFEEADRPCVREEMEDQALPDDDEDEDEDDEEEEENSDSEDDPDRLWCICKRPHNNRFMICCDVCEDWFHGKCVHVSKAMGQQMEEKGIEWVCPNCSKKKDQGSNASMEQKRSPSSIGRVSSKEDSERSPAVSTPRGGSGGGGSGGVVSSNEKVGKTSSQPAVVVVEASPVPTTLLSGVTRCVVCKKEARNSSIYCSDSCILAHAQETLTRDSKPSPSPSQAKANPGAGESPKTTADPRVIVFERRTGKVLTGADAPTRSNLKNWLKDNPTFEVVRPNNLNTLQIGGKTVTAIQTQGPGKLMKTNQGTSSGAQGKMVYTKVMGSKQTVLSPSNKKLVVLSGGQQRLSPKTIQQKSQGSPLARKSPVMRQTTIKIASQQGKSGAIGSPKQTTTKKQDGTKTAAGSQQQQQREQHQGQQQQKAVQKTPPAMKKSEPEPIRLNVRKTLTELLTTRIRESQDLSLSDEEISELALNIELELYKYFRDTGAKYKSKYRSLVFNIKDTKNLTLFRKIADRSLTPDAVVRLSPDEMASQELAEWREKETKHQLEMIKKNELDLMSQAKSIVVKTHKGELIIENDTAIDHVDPKTPVQDIVTALNSQEAGEEAGDDESSKDAKEDKSHSLSSEDSKWSKSSVTSVAGTTPSEERKKKDREKTRDKERGDSKSSSKSLEKEGEKVTRSKKLQEEDHRRSHSRGRSRRSRDRERSRDRKSTRSKDGKREEGGGGGDNAKESKDREQRHKSGKEQSGRERDKDRERRSRGKKDRGSKSRGSRDEDGNGRGSGKREGGERGKDSLQSGNGDDVKPIEDRLWRHIEEESTTTGIATLATTTTTSGATLDGNDSDVSDREPSSTVNIKTPDINDEAEREKDVAASNMESSQLEKGQIPSKSGPSHTVWRGFVNMVDVAKFFITATEVSGHAKDLMEDLPDTVDVVGRISHDTVWDYISKMKKNVSKEILVIRLTAANDEEKIPYITLYSYLNSRGRLGVVGNVSKNIKDFYIMPFSRQSHIPPVLLSLVGSGFEDQRPHLLLGIIVRNKRKRVATVASPVVAPPTKILKKDEDDSSLDKNAIRHHHHHLHHLHHSHLQQQSPPGSPRPIHKGLLLESLREKQTNVVTQMTLDSLNKAQVGMSRSSVIDNATISKLVPELSSKIDMTESPKGETPPPLLLPTSMTMEATPDGGILDEVEPDDGDEPYSPGGASDLDEPRNAENICISDSSNLLLSNAMASTHGISSPNKNSTELQRKMDELNRQIEEQKQQIQSISSSFLGDAVSTLPGLGLDPPDAGGNDSDEAYSPTDVRSFTPPPPSGIAKFAQPILDKVSDITIPPNLQEILANVKRQESSKIDPYLPSKPSATFLTSASSSLYPVKTTEKYTPTFINKSVQGSAETTGSNNVKETKSTLRSLSDLDLIKKAEEELAAVAGTTIFPTAEQPQSVPPALPPAFTSPPPPLPPPPPPPPHSPTAASRLSPELAEGLEKVDNAAGLVRLEDNDNKKTGSISLEQPKPPGLEDEDLPPMFPSTAPASLESVNKSPQKFVPKSGVVLSVKRKGSEELSASPTKTPRTKSRWGQGPTE